MAELIAEGTKANLSDIQNYEAQLKEGDEAMVTLNLSSNVGQTAVNILESGLRIGNVPLTRKLEYTTGSPARIRIYWRKGALHWAIILGIIISVALVIWYVITSWQLSKISPALGVSFMTIVPIVIIGLIAYLILKRKIPI